MRDSERVKRRRDTSIYGKRECVGDIGWRTVTEKRERESETMCGKCSGRGLTLE